MLAKKTRKTTQQTTILRVLKDADGGLTGRDLLLDAQILQPTINAATLYRNLNKLEVEGLVQRVSVAGKTFFESGEQPCHHFYCHGCERLLKVDPKAVRVPGPDAIMAAGGYTAEHVSFVIEGMCPNCSGEATPFSACASCPNLCQNVLRVKGAKEIPCKQS